MGNEKYPHWLLSINIFGLLLFVWITVTMQISVQEAKIKREVEHELKMANNVTGTETEKCHMKSFIQFWRPRNDCKQVYIPITFCYGMCYSVSIPHRRNWANVCRPTKWEYQNVTAACLESGRQIYITKQVKKIHECSCDLIPLE